MVKNQVALQILLSSTFATVKIQREEEQKSMISGQFLYFQFFQFFGNLEINFGIKLIKCF